MIGRGTRARWTLLLGAAALAAAAAPCPPALAGGVSENPWRDWENGWSIKPLLRWDTRPPSMPGTSESVRVAAGWYPKGRDSDDDSYCVVLALGRYFDEALNAPESKEAGPAPERFTKWMEEWLAGLRKRPRSTVAVSGDACKVGPQAGWKWEGSYSWHCSEIISGERYDWTEDRHILAVGARRGDYEVGVVFFVDAAEHYTRETFDIKTLRESALSLRFLDAKEMTKKRAELEAKVKKAGGEDEAWIVRVRAKIPAGWRYFRREDTVYIHPDGIPGSTVETMAIRLDTMRKRVYAKAFPAEIGVDAPPAVVKVTKDERQYLSYGAPRGSIGYFAGSQRELVLFYQAKDWWDTIDSTAVLFHEGFHQYVDQALDGLNAHPWFEEGFGDYYGGWRLFEGNPRPGELTARKSALEDILDEGAQIDLPDLLRMEWAAFYGRGEDAVNPGIAYAQSWSLATFLRSGKHSACVDRYWAALREGAKKWKATEASAAIKEGRPVRPAGEMPEAEAVAIRKAALEEGFRGVDLDALDDAWFEFANR